MNSLSDLELIQNYRKGEESALAILIQRYLAPVYRFLYRMVGDVQLAEDLTQDTFVKVWKHLSRFDAKKSFKTWIFTIAKNTTIDYFRKKNPVTFTELERNEESLNIAESIPDLQPLTPVLLERAETAKDLEVAMASIPPKSRSIVLMHETEDMTFQEIAEAMNEPMNTVKSRYRRGVLALREFLTDVPFLHQK